MYITVYLLVDREEITAARYVSERALDLIAVRLPCSDPPCVLRLCATPCPEVA